MGFLAYSIYTDPGIITKHIPFRSHGNAPVDNGGDVPDIQINDNRTNPLSWFFNVTSGIYNTYRGALNIFNPFYWVSTNSTGIELDTFLASQGDPHTSNIKLYPFTNENPYDSWFNKLRITYKTLWC